jgi:hypothetical protein
VTLEPVPPWTVSVLWDEARQQLIVLDPGARGFALYARDGQRRVEIPLDPALDLDYAVPMRLDRAEQGYQLLTRSRLLHLRSDLRVQAVSEPFEGLGPGWSSGSLGDGVFVDGVFYGYAEAIATDAEETDDAETPDLWRRGFARIDPAHRGLEWLLELPLDGNEEFAAYYFYDRRPYVAELDGRVYVLRLGEPWSLHRITRRGLRLVLAGEVGTATPMALYGWNRRLFLLSSETISTPSRSPMEAPTLVDDSRADGADLIVAWPVEQGRRWKLTEIDPRRDRVLREVEVPSAAERLRLIPGDRAWVALEENSAPVLGDQGSQGARALFLPTHELELGSFSCP